MSTDPDPVWDALREALKGAAESNERGQRAASALVATMRKLPPEISTARCR